MAFSGLHVTWGFVGGAPNAAPSNTPIYGAMTASEDPASGVVSTTTAPQPAAGQYPMASVHAFADSWVCVGPNPQDPSQATSTRRFIPAYTTCIDGVAFFCTAGDKIKWVAA